MAKRSRGAARPGQIRPATRRPQRPAGRSGAAATTEGTRAAVRPLVDDPSAEVADLDLPVVERAAPRRRERVEPTASAVAAAARVRSGQASGLLAQRAATEYAYVAKDVRHIGVVGGGLFVLLLVLYVLLEVVRIVKI